MKIYQIHAYGGQYEDRYDYIQSSYISREKAEHEKTLLEEKEYECELWDECPICGHCLESECNEEYCDDKEKCIDIMINAALKKCKMADLYKDENAILGFNCKNKVKTYGWDTTFYRIEEVSVIE